MNKYTFSERDIVLSKLPDWWVNLGWESIIKKLIFGKIPFRIYKNMDTLEIICESESKPPDCLIAGIKWRKK